MKKNPSVGKVGERGLGVRKCKMCSYSKDGVTNIAVNITKLFGRREVVQ